MTGNSAKSRKSSTASAKVDQISDAVAALVKVTNEDATAIRTLARKPHRLY
jgi:hypothetical protein